MKDLPNLDLCISKKIVTARHTNQIILQKKTFGGEKSCLSPHVQDTKSFARLDSFFSTDIFLFLDQHLQSCEINTFTLSIIEYYGEKIQIRTSNLLYFEQPLTKNDQSRGNAINILT